MTIASFFSGIGGLGRLASVCHNATMPRGAKPKVYPREIVERVRRLYASGMTQSEVAEEIGTTQKVIWRLMERHQIPRRPRIKRDQRGANNDSWKGDGARYAAMHLRVAAARGKPAHCVRCGKAGGAQRGYEWASLTKDFANPYDYIRLCRSCHHKMDDTVRNLGAHAKRKERSGP